MIFPQIEAPALEGEIAAPIGSDLLTLIQTTDTLKGVDNFHRNFSLPKFDSSLGVLDSLTLTLIGTAVGRVQLTNSSKLFTYAGEAYLDEGITVLLQTGSLKMGPLLTMNFLTEVGMMAVAPRGKKTSKNSGLLSASKTIASSAVLNYFTGLGSVRGKLQGAKFFCSDFPAHATGAVTVNAKLSIAYSYYPTAKLADRG